MPEIVNGCCGMCCEERVVARLQVAHRGELIAMSLCWWCLTALAASVHSSEMAQPFVQTTPVDTPSADKTE